MIDSEQNLVRAALDYLLVSGIPAWRNNTGARKWAYTNAAGQLKNQFLRWGYKGSGDIFAVLPPHGRFVSIECKRPGKEASGDQTIFMDAVNRVGGCAFVAHTLDEVIKGIEEAKARKK